MKIMVINTIHKFLYECLPNSWYIMIELIFLKELILISQVHKNSVIFITKEFKFQPHVCSGCHDVFMISLNLTDIAILNIDSADYRCIIDDVSKSVTLSLLKKDDLSKKRGAFQKIIFLYHI